MGKVDVPELQGLLEELPERQIAAVFERMSVDDAVAVVELLPPELEEKVLEIVDVGNLDEVQAHLTYSGDSAGRLMVPAYLALNAETTVRDAIATIRSSEDVDNVFYLYVVDLGNHLVGVASLRQLLLSLSVSFPQLLMIFLQLSEPLLHAPQLGLSSRCIFL